jgi:membrane-associated phospholipid phosphatase
MPHAVTPREIEHAIRNVPGFPPMHWLQTLDTIPRLFDFRQPVVGQPGLRLADAGFERQRLFLSRPVPARVGLLWKGNVRLRLCILLLVLILPLGDACICNTIKHAVARPRPFVTLPEARNVRQPSAKATSRHKSMNQGVDMAANQGSRTSMPSSHAANWFAATMILFLFYRRSLWFMLPLALAVSFSRVYNGVHYPSDVLAGAILGAGYAAAGAIALQTAWQWIGKKWFPLWHAQCPRC